MILKAHANGTNIVGQQHPTLLGCDLLRPVCMEPQQCWHLLRTEFETGQTFRPMQTDASLLANNTQQCWELLALVASVCIGLKNGIQCELTRHLPIVLVKVAYYASGSARFLPKLCSNYARFSKLCYFFKKLFCAQTSQLTRQV